MKTKGNTTYLLNDPLDRWVRVAYIVENYMEPKSSLHDMIDSGALKAKQRGTVLYVNERQYQDYLESLPDATQSQSRRNVRARSQAEEPVADGGQSRSAAATRALVLHKKSG